MKPGMHHGNRDEATDESEGALGLAVMGPWLSPQECAVADQRPVGPDLRFWGSLPPRPGEDAARDRLALGVMIVPALVDAAAGRIEQVRFLVQPVPLTDAEQASRSDYCGIRFVASLPDPPIAYLTLVGRVQVMRHSNTAGTDTRSIWNRAKQRQNQGGDSFRPVLMHTGLHRGCNPHAY